MSVSYEGRTLNPKPQSGPKPFRLQGLGGVAMWMG